MQTGPLADFDLALDGLDDDCILLVLSFIEPGSRDVVNFSHLSKRYRNIALYTPHLWSVIRWVDYEEHSSHSAQWWFDIQLARAGRSINLSMELEATSTSARAHVNRRRLYKRLSNYSAFARIQALQLVACEDSWSPWLDTIVHTPMPKLQLLDVKIVWPETEIAPLAGMDIPALTRVTCREAAVCLLIPADPAVLGGLWPNVRFVEISYNLRPSRDWIGYIVQVFPAVEELRVWNNGNIRFSSGVARSEEAGRRLRKIDLIPAGDYLHFQNMQPELASRVSHTVDLSIGLILLRNLRDFEDVLALVDSSGSNDAHAFQLARVMISGSPMSSPVYASSENRALLEHAREFQDLGIHISVSFYDNHGALARRRGARTPIFEIAVLLVDTAFASANQRASRVEVEINGHDAWKLFVSVLRPKGGGAPSLSKVAQVIVHVPDATQAAGFFPLPKLRGDRSRVPVPALQEVILRAPVGRAVILPRDVLDELLGRFVGVIQPPRLNLIGVLVARRLQSS